MVAVYRNLQGCVLDRCGQGGDPCGALHGGQHLCAVWFECCQEQGVGLQDLRLLDQNLVERCPKDQNETLNLLKSNLKD